MHASKRQKLANANCIHKSIESHIFSTGEHFTLNQLVKTISFKGVQLRGGRRPIISLDQFIGAVTDNMKQKALHYLIKQSIG